MSVHPEPSAELRAVVDAWPVNAWMMDAADGRAYMNRTYREYIGLDVDVTHGSWLTVDDWLTHLDPRDHERAVAIWRERQASPDGFDAEFRVRRHDGVWRRVLVRARPVRDDAGVMVRWVGTSTDVEDERRMGDELLRRALDTGLVLAAADDAAKHERGRLATQLRTTALDPLEATAQRLQRAGHTEESSAITRALEALRDALEHE